MEQERARTKMAGNMRNIRDHAVILDRRFLDDEQLIRSEQLAVLEEIFNTNVRERELREISCHFAPVLRRDHPYHLALWGKTGTGKTLTMIYFLNFLAEMCRKEGMGLRYVHLDLTTARPCFRALNDLACLLNCSKRYRRGISLEELMGRIEAALERYHGYLILFIDEVDNVRRDKDTFLAFLVRRLPQQVRAKLILVFASNHLNWPDHLDPRTKSFLKLNELVFEPYDAIDLRRILDIRVRKALRPQAVEPGVVEKIAALASREHGDARKAVALLARSAHLAEKGGSCVSIDTVDEAAREIEQDKYTTLIRTAPAQLQAALAGIIEGMGAKRANLLGSGEAYDAYRTFCARTSLKPLSGRAFGDLVIELDMYSFLRTRLESKGRYGRTREIVLDVPGELAVNIYHTILLNFDVQGRPSDRLRA